MVKKYKLNMGFTLVELLIVITLIAILAVAIVATLNPIEQINRARDARYKNDASELLGAIERYYTSTGEYPWMDASLTADRATLSTASFAGVGELAGVGVCSGTDYNDETTYDCNTDGILITSDELKSQFKNKDQFSGTVTDEDKLYVYKAENDSSIYVCFIPKANVNHSPSERVKLWDLGMTGGAAIPQSILEVETEPPESIVWGTRNDSYFICVPE
jgi:prepilin-type N-terminal cleavage/methylation domain-containing protein